MVSKIIKLWKKRLKSLFTTLKYKGFISLISRTFKFFKIKYLVFIGKDYLNNQQDLKDLIKNQRVLILGSGPSANDLKNIPENVKILTCNASPKIMLDKNIEINIDLYFFSITALNDKRAFRVLSKTNPSFLITSTNISSGKINYKKLIKDSCYNNSYLKKLIKPKKIKDIIDPTGVTHWTSSGMRLLQYALYFGAKEIYLAGIDGGFGNYAWGEKTKFKHKYIDNKFMKIISKKYKNIYSISKDSPITKYIPHKELE